MDKWMKEKKTYSCHDGVASKGHNRWQSVHRSSFYIGIITRFYSTWRIPLWIGCACSSITLCPLDIFRDNGIKERRYRPRSTLYDTSGARCGTISKIRLPSNRVGERAKHKGAEASIVSLPVRFEKKRQLSLCSIPSFGLLIHPRLTQRLINPFKLLALFHEPCIGTNSYFTRNIRLPWRSL